MGKRDRARAYFGPAAVTLTHHFNPDPRWIALHAALQKTCWQGLVYRAHFSVRSACRCACSGTTASAGEPIAAHSVCEVAADSTSDPVHLRIAAAYEWNALMLSALPTLGRCHCA